MPRRRVPPLVALLAGIAAALAAVRACNPPDGEEPPGADRVAPETSRARAPVERRHVRDSAPPGVDDAPPAEPDATSDVAGPHDAPPAADETVEVVVAVSDATGRRMAGVDVTVRVPVDWLVGGQPVFLDQLWSGFVGEDGASLPGPPVSRTDASGVARLRSARSTELLVIAASDAWRGEAVADVKDGPGSLEVAVTVVPAFRLSGRVLHGDGTPVAGADVYVGVPLPGRAARMPRRLQVVGTDAEGRFRCDAHPVPDTRIVECYVMADTIAGFSKRFPVTQGAVAGVEIVVPRGGIVVGRCVDEDGRPLSGVRVRGILPPTGEITFTGGDGRFRMPVPGGGGGLIFFVDGRVQTGRAGLLGTPEGTDVGDVLVPRGDVLAGRVVDEGGRPVAGAAVWIIEPVTLHSAAHVVTDDDGAFRSDLIGPGTHHLLVQHRAADAPDGAVASVRADGFRAGTTDAVVVLPRASWTTVRVVDPVSGEPLAFGTGVYTLTRVDGAPYLAAHRVFETAGETRSAFPVGLPGPGTYDAELEISTTGATDTRRVVVRDGPLPPIVLAPR